MTELELYKQSDELKQPKTCKFHGDLPKESIAFFYFIIITSILCIAICIVEVIRGDSYSGFPTTEYSQSSITYTVFIYDDHGKKIATYTGVDVVSHNSDGSVTLDQNGKSTTITGGIIIEKEE